MARSPRLPTQHHGRDSVFRGSVNSARVASNAAARGHGRLYLIDATSHHLGDELSTSGAMLDPPEPEGAVLERSIELRELPGGPWFLVLDVLDVVGENSND